MAEFRVSPQTLQQKADELRSLNGRFKSAIETLQQQESALNGQWDGDAHNAFHTAFGNDVTRMTAFYTAVEEYATRLTQIAQDYITAENKNINTANSRSI